MSYRRRLMAVKKEESIAWDYEWYPPEEKPSWFTVTNTNVTTEEGSDYFRLYCANAPGNAMTRLLYGFLASEFPNTKSYLVEIDMIDKVSRYASSNQGGLCFSKFTGVTGIWIRNNNSARVPDTDYYQAKFASSASANDGPVITNNLRYTLRLLYDNTNGIFKATVDDKEFSISGTGIAPREVYTRYSNNNYVDIYSVKIKVLDNE